jgi:hypothetical protein
LRLADVEYPVSGATTATQVVLTCPLLEGGNGIGRATVGASASLGHLDRGCSIIAFFKSLSECLWLLLQQPIQGGFWVFGDNQPFFFRAALRANLGRFRSLRHGLPFPQSSCKIDPCAGDRTRTAVSPATRLQTAHVCQFRHAGIRRDRKCAGCRGGGPLKTSRRSYSIRAVQRPKQ